MFNRFIPLVLLLLILNACLDNSHEIVSEFNLGAEQIRQKTIPDKALDVFKFQLKKDKTWILEGESTSPDAVKHMRQLAESLLGEDTYQDNFRLLPDAAFADSAYALVIVSVTPLRREARHASEILDQVIMGNQLQLLQRNKGWYLVRNHYGYIGWINKTAIQRTDKKGLDVWNRAERVQVKELFAFVYERPSTKALHLSDLVLNSALKKVAQIGRWMQVELPDGEQGFVPVSDLQPYLDNLNPDNVAVKNLICTAKSMLGIPYLWGGKSSKANDCSGFTQIVFRTNGIQLPRDASQQALIGAQIIPKENFSNVQAGDLLFFGMDERITHVGISLGGYDFIHQDSDVHVDSFDEQAENFNAFRKKSLKIIKRILH